jgi:3-hydroxymyristoyl/3-hydroxydecanoyl-(acyl carrier protein) dehydratase
VSTIIGAVEIRQRLPLAPPVWMLDRVEVDDDRKTLRAIKCVSMAEEHFMGHFPDHPVLPGVLQIEAMVQLATLAFAEAYPETAAKGVMLTNVQRVRFRKPVLPGDLLQIELTVDEIGEDHLVATAATSVEGARTCDVQLALAPRGEMPLPTTLNVPMRPIPNPEGAMNVEQVMKAIPHRYPFLMVDRILSARHEDDRVMSVGLKNLTANEPFLRRQSRQDPALPNVFLMEICAQVACIFALTLPDNVGKIGYFMSIENADFFRPAVAGDQLFTEANLQIVKQRFGVADCSIYAGDEHVMACTVKVALVDR